MPDVTSCEMSQTFTFINSVSDYFHCCCCCLFVFPSLTGPQLVVLGEVAGVGHGFEEHNLVIITPQTVSL